MSQSTFFPKILLKNSTILHSPNLDIVPFFSAVRSDVKLKFRCVHANLEMCSLLSLFKERESRAFIFL